MIGKAMEGWPDDALQRVADAPDEGWACGSWFLSERDCGCLAHKFFGWDNAAAAYLDIANGLPVDPLFGVASRGGRYEKLCIRYGAHPNQIDQPVPQPVLSMLRNRARRILARRSLNCLPRSVVVEAS